MRNSCKHDAGFTCLRWENTNYLPGGWFCNLNCGFQLNFDPFTYPHGVAYVVRENTKPGPTLTLSHK